MLYAVHQPHYLPWIRYLHKIAAADVFVLLDDAQYTKNGWQSRNRVKGPNGPILLTVPVRARLGELLSEVRPAGTGWVRRHLTALDSCYGRALRPWRPALVEALTAFADAPLALLNEVVLRVLLDAFGIRTPMVRSSELGVGGRGSARLAAIGRALGADVYITGAHALGAYLAPSAFEAESLGLAAQRWECPRYPQRFPAVGFVPDLSAVDLLANRPEDAQQVALSGGDVAILFAESGARR